MVSIKKFYIVVFLKLRKMVIISSMVIIFIWKKYVYVYGDVFIVYYNLFV